MRALLAALVKRCCLEEARRSLRKHRDVATCDGCGNLLLAYDNDRDFENTTTELTRHGVSFETEGLGKLRVVSKSRKRSTP